MGFDEKSSTMEFEKIIWKLEKNEFTTENTDKHRENLLQKKQTAGIKRFTGKK